MRARDAYLAVLTERTSAYTLHIVVVNNNDLGARIAGDYTCSSLYLPHPSNSHLHLCRASPGVQYTTASSIVPNTHTPTDLTPYWSCAELFIMHIFVFALLYTY